MTNEFANKSVAELKDFITNKEDFYTMPKERQEAFLEAYKSAIEFEDDFLVESTDRNAVLKLWFNSSALGGDYDD